MAGCDRRRIGRTGARFGRGWRHGLRLVRCRFLEDLLGANQENRGFSRFSRVRISPV